MNFPSREIVERIKRDYPVGCTVELVHMNDPYTDIPPGTRGRVRSVDDCGTIFADWSTGSGLGIVYGEDSCRRVD